jgi:hypothetical protein
MARRRLPAAADKAQESVAVAKRHEALQGEHHGENEEEFESEVERQSFSLRMV